MSDLANNDLSVHSGFIDGQARGGHTNRAVLAVALDGQPLFEHDAGLAHADLPAGPGVLCDDGLYDSIARY